MRRAEQRARGFGELRRLPSRQRIAQHREGLLELVEAFVAADHRSVGPVRDFGLLGSAAHRPQVAFHGKEAYPGVDAPAAVLLESVVRNHALIDGNRRLGWLAAVAFHGLDDISLRAATTRLRARHGRGPWRTRPPRTHRHPALLPLTSSGLSEREVWRTRAPW